MQTSNGYKMQPKIQKIIFIFILFIFLAYSTTASIHENPHNDERIYVLSSAYAGMNIDRNPEHPPLVKYLYSFYFNNNEKELLRSIADDPNKLYLGEITKNEYLIVWQAINRVRIINSILFLLILLFFYKKQRLVQTLFILSIMLLSGLMYSAMLDSWLVFITLIAYFLLQEKNKIGYAIAFFFLPLIKIYGFILSAILSVIAYSNDYQKQLTNVMMVLLALYFFYDPTHIAFAIKHFSTSIGGGASFARYAIPFYAIFLLELSKRARLVSV